MIVYMPWHQALIINSDRPQDYEMPLSYLRNNYPVNLFPGLPEMSLVYYLTKDLAFLHSLHYACKKSYIEPRYFPSGWQLFRFELVREHQ